MERVPGDDIALCLWRLCARSTECTSPTVCVHPESAGIVDTTRAPVCAYPTALQPTGL